jgi:hypothetical protein
MAAFLLGQRVVVNEGYPTGIGTIHGVIGGPVDFSYQVLMDQRGEDGQRIMAMSTGPDLSPSIPILPYEVGQRVTYFGRSCVVTDKIAETNPADPRDAVLRVLCDQDPVECFSGVEHNYLFVLPAWKLYSYAR